MNDKHIINEYFNTYYPKKKVFIHNEMVELLFGLFLGFFFSALKDTINNRAVQIVQRLDDPRIANNFIKDNEKIITQIGEYAEGNKKLEEKLKNIEEVLGDLQKKLKEAKTSPETETIPSPASTPIEEKNPTVIAITDLTIKITEIFTELQKSGEANQNDIKELIKEIGKNFDKIGLPQEIISKKIVENVKNANEITKEKADEIIQFSEIIVLPPEKEIPKKDSEIVIKIEGAKFTATNNDGQEFNIKIFGPKELPYINAFLKQAIETNSLKQKNAETIQKKLNLIQQNFLTTPIKIKVDEEGKVFKDNKKTKILLLSEKLQTIEIFNKSILKDLNDEKSYKKLFLQSRINKKALPELEVPKNAKTQDKEAKAELEAPKEIKVPKKITEDWLKNKKFDVGILFNNDTKLKETESKGSSIKIESDAIIVLLTNYKLSESDFKNNEKEISFESKIIKYLFEAEEKKIEIMGDFKVKLSEDQFNKILETKTIPKNIVKSLIDKIKEKFDEEKQISEPITLEEVLNSTLDFYYIFNQFILKNKSIDRFAFNTAKKSTKLSIIKFDEDLADISLKNFSITAEDINEMPKENKEKFLYINEKGPITLNGDIKVGLVNDIEINTEKNSIKFNKVFTDILFDEIIKKANKTKKEQIERDEALNKEDLEKKKNTLLNKKFELNNLFNDLKLKETEDENNYFGLKKQDSDYLLFAKLTNYELSENDINHISKEKEILIESKIIKYLFEAQEKKISITGEFSINLSEQKIENIIQTKVFQQDDINKLITEIRKAFNAEAEKVKVSKGAQEAPSEDKKKSNDNEANQIQDNNKEKTKNTEFKFPEKLYWYKWIKLKNKNILKENTKLTTELQKENKSIIIFTLKESKQDSAIYIGEININKEDNISKNQLENILEQILKQEAKQQLTITVDKNFKIIKINNKGKLSSPGLLDKFLRKDTNNVDNLTKSDYFKFGIKNNNTITISNITSIQEGKEYVLLLPLINNLYYINLTKQTLPDVLRKLRTFAGYISKNKRFAIRPLQKSFSVNLPEKFVEKDKNFMNNLTLLINKLKTLFQNDYINSLRESRQTPIVLSNIAIQGIGIIETNWDGEWGNSYTIQSEKDANISSNEEPQAKVTTNTPPAQNNSQSQKQLNTQQNKTEATNIQKPKYKKVEFKKPQALIIKQEANK